MTRRGIGSYDDDDDTDTRSKKPVEVELFVHKRLPKSLLCSEHGRNDYQNRELVKGKVIAWQCITWPDKREREKLRAWEAENTRRPITLTFAVEEWLAYEKGLI